MLFRVKAQLAEVLGQDNRWFCSNFHRKRVEDPNKLLEYFIRKGGAVDFAKRYAEAMGDENRWYCSQHHKRDVRDEQTLWEYYLSHTCSSRNCG